MASVNLPPYEKDHAEGMTPACGDEPLIGQFEVSYRDSFSSTSIPRPASLAGTKM
jgi:hypothetical protein